MLEQLDSKRFSELLNLWKPLECVQYVQQPIFELETLYGGVSGHLLLMWNASLTVKSNWTPLDLEKNAYKSI
jgi:hypothetical protein